MTSANPSPAAAGSRQRPFTALYVHVPFCRRKCGYCAFYSLPNPAAERFHRWQQRLHGEFAEFAARCAPLASVFIGGGTPTLLPPAGLAALLADLRNNFILAPGAEVTSEANPETVTPEVAETLAAGGVNRVSLGVQSFQPDLRRTLDRAGDPAAAGTAVAALRQAGIDNLGADLIYAIPGQTPEQWRDDLHRALELGIAHLSTYALTREEGARLAPSFPPPDPDYEADLWELAETEAARYGLQRYEVSNFARPGHACRHNLDIWLGTAYLGCGPAACSFDGALRWSNPPDFDAWLADPVPREFDPLPPERRAAEILVFGLRTTTGWTRAGFRDRTGFDYLELRGPLLQRFQEQGLLEGLPEAVRPTPRGLLLHDHLAIDLL
ncbi:MAG: radical SAM family heme chaperone HemW [Lentisphaeria bacterium]